ncbi:MAG: MFS transporter, partial [Caldimonas sp.]
LTLVGGFASTLSFPAVVWLIAWLDWRGALAVVGAILLCAVAPLHAWALRGNLGHSMQAAQASPADDATVHEAIRQPAFWFLTTAFALHSFAVAAIFAHLMPALAEKGLSEAESLAVVVWFGPAQVLARFTYASLRTGRTPPLLALAVIAGMPLALAIFAVSNRTVGLLCFSILFGLSNGLVTIVRGSLVPDYFGRRHVGRISGAMSAIALLSRAAAPFAIAWMLIPLHSYRNVLWALTALGVGAVCAYAAAGRPRDSMPASMAPQPADTTSVHRSV